MLARVSKFEARPERLDEMAREGVEHVLPALKMQDGFAGALVLTDRPSGKVLAVTFWESEQAMDVTEEASHWLRASSAEAASGMVRDVERYETFLSEVSRLAGPES